MSMVRTIYTPMLLKCQNCELEWWYTGNSLVRTACPDCGSSVTIKKSNPEGWLFRSKEFELLNQKGIINY